MGGWLFGSLDGWNGLVGDGLDDQLGWLVEGYKRWVDLVQTMELRYLFLEHHTTIRIFRHA